MEERRIDWLPIDELVRYPKNPKRHALDAIGDSVQAVGFVTEMRLNETTGRLLEGHGRLDYLLAQKKAGKEPPEGIREKSGKWLAPVVRGIALTEAQEDRFVVAANRLVELGGWDDKLLADLLSEVADAEGGLLGTGYDAEALGDLLLSVAPPKEQQDPAPQVDRAAELQAEWKTERGQVWQAGDHFVICGDCRELPTWVALLQAAGVEKINGVFTSPPYAEQRKEQYGGVPTAEYVAWWEAVQANVRANLAGDGSFFVNIKPHCEDGERVLYVFDLVLAMKRQWGWRFVDELCWVHQGTIGRWDERLKNQFEPILQFTIGKSVVRHGNVLKEWSPKSRVDELGVYDGKDNAAPKSGSPFRQSAKRSAEFDGALPGNVVSCPLGATATNSGAFQAAAFPTALPTFFVKAYSDAGDVWLDPFLGSGTTIVAAHNEGRRGLGIEKLPKYVAVSLQRMFDLTGETPRLVAAASGDG